MSEPDDARFRPGDPTPDEYPVGEGYEQDSPSTYSAPTPYGALGTPGPAQQPWGRPAPPQQVEAQPYLPTGTPVTGGPPSRDRARRPSAASLMIVGALVLVLVVTIVAAVASRIGGGDVADPTAGPTNSWPEDIEHTWTMDFEALATPPDDALISYHPDGAFTGPQIITGDAAWVVAWADEDYVNGGLVSMDPSTGAVLWERALAEVVCADALHEGTLLCLSHAGATWTFHRIDAVTGEELVSTPTSLAHVQTVHTNGDVLVAIGAFDAAPHAEVAGIDVAGTVLWSFDVATLPAADLLFTSVYDSDGEPVLERPRWRNLDGGLVMLWSTPGLAVIDPATGEAFVQECRSATARQDHYYCLVKENLERYELDGTRTWTAAGLRPAVPEDSSDTRLVALSEPTANQFEVIPLDPATGEVSGAATYRFGQQPGTWTGIILPPSIYAEPDATFLVGDTAIVALHPDTGELLWSTPHEEIYAGDIVQVGDVAVLNAGSLIGMDIATGEVLWSRDYRGDVSRVGDALISISLDEVALLTMP